MVTPSTGPANLHRPSTFEDSTGDSARREEGLAQEGSEAGAESPENSLDTNSNASGAESAENHVAQARKEDQHFRFRPFATPFDQSGVETSSTSGPFSDSAPAELDAPWSQQEVDMMALSYAIRAKEKWWEKRKDSGIREKWKREALAAAASTEEGLVAGAEGEEEEETRPRLTEKMVEYVLDELELHEKRLSDPDGIRDSCFTSIFDSDSLISSSLRSALLAHIANLEAEPPFGEPDWHPGSNELVLDLLHPSLYPLQHDVTPVRVEGEEGELTVGKAPAPRNAVHSTSKKYQWLPADFDVDDDGKVTISSYINNLHPTLHASFYPVLASLFQRFIPLFERVLSSLQSPPPRGIPIDWAVASEWYGAEEYEGDEEAEDFWEKYEEFMEKRELKLPEPERFAMPKEEDEARIFSLNGRKLQVITKIASIHLTPEKPTYGGGVWHVEGMQNEEIVTSGIYYFDQENITESQLAFRGTFNDLEVPYEQNDDRGVRAVFGIENDGPCIQSYNALTTSHHRCIAFRNIYQHQVSPFSLVDPSKPGYRKILVFFLVDPLKRIVSTSSVPPQQRDWVAREVALAVEQSGEESAVRRVPPEIWDNVFDDAGLLGYQEAKQVREELMRERKFLVEENTTVIFERPFSLCEH